MASVNFSLTDDEKKKKAELEAKHGVACYLIRGGGVDSWAKEPTIADIDNWMTENSDPRIRGKALLDLFGRNIADGTRESVFAKRPGAVVAHAGAYAEAVGITADAVMGK
jgi:hypothetical protein